MKESLEFWRRVGTGGPPGGFKSSIHEPQSAKQAVWSAEPRLF